MEEAGTASPARFHRACTVLGNLNVEEGGAAYLSWQTLEVSHGDGAHTSHG